MILFDMKVQEMIRREVFAALRAAIDMGLLVMNLVVFVRSERESLAVRRQSTLHNLGDRLWLSV